MTRVRTPLPSNKLSQKKKRYWTAREKLTVLMYLDKVPNASVRGTADMFAIQPNQIRAWRKNKEQLMLAQPRVKCLNAGARPSYPVLEEEVYNWVKSLRSNLKVVTRSMIQIKSRALAKTPRYIEIYPNAQDFKWSNKWVNSFMKRHNLSNRRRTTVAQRLPDDLEMKQSEFLNFVLYCCIQHDYPLELIGNMDETPLTFDMPSTTTIEEIGSRTVSIRTCGHEKSNFTVVLACMANGTKLPPMIIFKLKKIPRLDFPTGVIIRTNKEGWMNAEEMLYWIEHTWVKRAPMAVEPRSLLVMDSFRGHLVDSVKHRFQEKNTNIAIIPGGLTSKLQPLDVYINKPFKSKVR